jgi:hypothetical protein
MAVKHTTMSNNTIDFDKIKDLANMHTYLPNITLPTIKAVKHPHNFKHADVHKQTKI